jgi:hypothetical protein
MPCGPRRRPRPRQDAASKVSRSGGPARPRVGLRGRAGAGPFEPLDRIAVGDDLACNCPRVVEGGVLVTVVATGRGKPHPAQAYHCRLSISLDGDVNGSATPSTTVLSRASAGAAAWCGLPQDRREAMRLSSARCPACRWRWGTPAHRRNTNGYGQTGGGGTGARLGSHLSSGSAGLSGPGSCAPDHAHAGWIKSTMPRRAWRGIDALKDGRQQRACNRGKTQVASDSRCASQARVCPSNGRPALGPIRTPPMDDSRRVDGRVELCDGCHSIDRTEGGVPHWVGVAEIGPIDSFEDRFFYFSVAHGPLKRVKHLSKK